MKFRLLAATAIVVATPAYAADNMTVKDGTGATKVLAKKDVGSVLYDRNIVVLQSDVTVDAMAQIDGHVDGIESLLTTETNNTSGISGKLPASLGSKTGATSLSVVPANDGFSVQCTSGCSGGVQKNEDDASANGDTGTIALAVRKATPANTSGADGDYEALQINAGNLWTKDSTLNTAVGTTSDATVTAGFSTCSLIACIRAVANAALDTTPASTNLSQVGGNTVLTGNGVTGTGSQRVTIASDQTAFSVNVGTVTTLPALVAGSALIGKVGIDQTTVGTTNAVSIGQLGANTISSGNGTAGTGTLRVSIASDSTGQVALAAGTNTIGAAYGFAGTATTTITRPADTSAYTANDAFADSTSAPTTGGFTLSSMCRSSGGSGILTDATFVYSTSVAVSGIVYLYDSAPTAQNDNAAWSVSDSDQLKLVGTIPFTTVADGANAVQNVQNLNLGYTCSGSSNLRYMVKITTAYTPASGDTLTLRAKFVQTN